MAWGRAKRQHANWNAFEKVENLYANFGIEVRGETGGNFYNPSDDFINIVPQKHWYATQGNTVEYRYYRCRCHELIHWTGGKKRLNRINFKRWGDQAYALEELTAELGACMLMNILGYSENESMDYHADYFQSWLKDAGNREEAIKQASDRAKEAVEYILTNGGIL